MNDNPKISIIVPVYNSEKYLSVCIDSLLNQTYENIEIIAIDDGSTDNSLEILRNYEKNNSNIKVYTQENHGVGYTRNMGLSYVTGEYFTFSDNDDYMEPDYLETFIKNNDNDYDILVSGYLRKNYNGKILFSRKLSDKPLSMYIQQGCWGKLYKTSFIKENNLFFTNSKIADEFYFNVIGYNLTNKIKILNTTKYHWMYNDESLSNTDNKKLNYVDELLSVLERIDCKLKETQINDIELINYFYLRTVIYYLLFSCKKVEKSKILESYNKMFGWLEEKNKKIYKNSYIGLLKKSGEQFSVRIIIFLFVLLKKIKLDKIAIILYSKI